jgi:hypothetical protein
VECVQRPAGRQMGEKPRARSLVAGGVGCFIRDVLGPRALGVPDVQHQQVGRGLCETGEGVVDILRDLDDEPCLGHDLGDCCRCPRELVPRVCVATRTGDQEGSRCH